METISNKEGEEEDVMDEEEEDEDEKEQGVESVFKAGSGSPEGFFLCMECLMQWENGCSFQAIVKYCKIHKPKVTNKCYVPV